MFKTKSNPNPNYISLTITISYKQLQFPNPNPNSRFVAIVPYTMTWMPTMISSQQYMSFPTLLDNALFYLSVPLAVIICLLPVYITYSYQTIFRKHTFEAEDQARIKNKQAHQEAMPEWQKQIANVFTLEANSYASVVYRLRCEGAGGQNYCMCTSAFESGKFGDVNDQILDSKGKSGTGVDSISNSQGTLNRARTDAAADGVVASPTSPSTDTASLSLSV